MQREGLFNFVPPVLGVDPASRIVGCCLMRGDGEVIKTWSVRARAGSPLRRLYTLHEGMRAVFSEVENLMNADDLHHLIVYIEEGIFGGGKEPIRAMPRNAAMAGEVRGMICALAWRNWKVCKMFVQSWKAMLSKEERKMKKDAAYVSYWNVHLGLSATSPDEIDAVLIARRAIIGGRKK